MKDFHLLVPIVDILVVRCPFLEVPTNGNRSVSGYSVGDNATFWCYEGFELLQGASFIVCREDGGWSGTAPMCVRKIGM
jgi:hypothetical protein